MHELNVCDVQELTQLTRSDRKHSRSPLLPSGRAGSLGRDAPVLFGTVMSNSSISVLRCLHFALWKLYIQKLIRNLKLLAGNTQDPQNPKQKKQKHSENMNPQ